MNRQLELRESNINAKTILDPANRVVGSFLSEQDVEDYAKEQGWKFKRDQSIYGGYFVEPGTGRSFYVL